MTERTSQILEAVIQEHIDTGEPVSSGLLYENYDFGIKPAMIRLELDELERQGYLEQPHESNMREHVAKQNELRQLLEEHAWPNLLNELSNQLGLLSIAADIARESVYKAGLEQLIDRLDWHDHKGICSVIHDFEAMDARLPGAAAQMNTGPNIFIGKKSPVTRSENLSVICGNYTIGDATISIFAIGPKRMDYKKVIRVFKNL
jgi:transcriptional regulator of heat shock response